MSATESQLLTNTPGQVIAVEGNEIHLPALIAIPLGFIVND